MLFHLGFNVANYLLRTPYIVKGIDLVQKTLTTLKNQEIEVNAKV
jgi:hypothetical protein